MKPGPAQLAPTRRAAFVAAPDWLLAAVLALATLAVFWPATHCGFVNFDDPAYVTENPQVQRGLTAEGIQWAFSSVVSANWHPVTMLTHMLDCQFHGLDPWGHHLTSVLLHVVNAALVFVLLRQMTGAVWRSWLVAAFFALHPLRVESVAWISERKDVLSGCFGLLALIFYVRYVNEARVRAATSNLPAARRAGTVDYVLAAVFLALGLMSKAMLVTWPLVMLLLDYWPLRRHAGASPGREHPSPALPPLCSAKCGEGEEAERRLHSAHPPSPGQIENAPDAGERARFIFNLVREKIPFIALAAASCVVTYLAQQHGGAVAHWDTAPLGDRIGNALVSYFRYVEKIVWPTQLSPLYLEPGDWPLAIVLLAGAALVAITIAFWLGWRRYPFLLVGWLWFCGTLVPVIGLVQVGVQAMADRYTYLPSLGLLILVVWGGFELIRRQRVFVGFAAAVAVIGLVLCAVATRHQIAYWQNGETLFRRALAVTQAQECPPGDPAAAHYNLGTALFHLGAALDDQDKIDEAIQRYQQAMNLKPADPEIRHSLGVDLDKAHDPDDAVGQLQESLRLKPNDATTHNDLGNALDHTGRTDEAIAQYQQALQMDPANAQAHSNLGAALGRKGDMTNAIVELQAALRLNPDDPLTHYNLGMALLLQSRTNDAILQLREALRLKPDFAAVSNRLSGLGVGK